MGTLLQRECSNEAWFLAPILRRTNRLQGDVGGDVCKREESGERQQSDDMIDDHEVAPLQSPSTR